VEREPASAVAWSELGVTQRMRGEFKDAAASYEQAISADPQFAPAYRNLAVVSDLYLGDPGRALIALTRYQELTHEEKPVGSWIAELRQRLGLPPVKRPEATPQAPATQPGAAPATAPAQAPAATPAGTTPAGAEPNRAAATPGAGV
jgi:tetratricopeptide (TPR) repeat protein